MGRQRCSPVLLHVRVGQKIPRETSGGSGDYHQRVRSRETGSSEPGFSGPGHPAINPTYRELACDNKAPEGSRKATNSPGNSRPLIETTMYCCPFNMYVMGEPLCGAGMSTAPTS